jgi:hypothetical protein
LRDPRFQLGKVRPNDNLAREQATNDCPKGRATPERSGKRHVIWPGKKIHDQTRANRTAAKFKTDSIAANTP